MPELHEINELLDALDILAHSGRDRLIIGITGAPGAGKSTLVEAVLEARPDAAWVPMDGFHLADSSLTRLGLLERKGAIDTFDAFGYLATLRRLHSELHNDVYTPEFDRTIEQPIAAGVVVSRSVRLVLTEGNYLLDASAPWPEVREQFAEVWYCDAPNDLRRERLIDRHIRYGKPRAEAVRWVDEIDEPNARRIAARRYLADAFVQLNHAPQEEHS